MTILGERIYRHNQTLIENQRKQSRVRTFYKPGEERNKQIDRVYEFLAEQKLQASGRTEKR